MKRTGTAAVAVLLAAGLASCGGTSEPSAAAPQQASTAAETAVPVAPVIDSKLDAEGVAKALGSAGLPVEVSVVFTEESDNNSLLGRPGQYTSKVAFIDSRVDEDKASSEKGDIEQGSGVEVFETEKAAKTRADYIKSITESIAMVAEYAYQVGPRVLRLSRYLTPAQAEAYNAAFEKLR